MSAEPIPFAAAQPSDGNNPDTREFVQALNELLPPRYTEIRDMTPEVRETLTETMWYHNTTELLQLVAPPIVGTKFLCEILPVFAPMIRKLHALAVANGKMAADNPLRLTWRMIDHRPTSTISTNGREVRIQPEDAICWAAICAEKFESSPQYINKLTNVVKALPPLPEEPTEKEAEESSDNGSDASGTGGAANGAEDGNKDAEAKTGNSTTKKRAASKKRKTAKATKTKTKGQEPDPGKGVILIPAPKFTKGDVEALYNFLDGNGCGGLVPLTAVFAGLEEAEFQSKLSRFCNRIAYAFFPNKLNVRVEGLGEN